MRQADQQDPTYFPTTSRIQEVFTVFGPIIKVDVLSGSPIKVIIHLEHAISATALINSTGHEIGGRPIRTYPYQPAATMAQLALAPPAINERKPFTFDPFRESSPGLKVTVDSRLNASSNPFIPPASIQLPLSDRTASSGKLSELSGSSSKNSNSHSAFSHRSESRGVDTWN